MRHDAERERTHALLDSAPVPGHWDEVLADLRASPLTSLSDADILAEATGLLIVAPTAEVVEACFGDVLAAFEEPVGTTDGGDGSGDAAAGPSAFTRVVTPDSFVPSDVPAGTWVFLPHRSDGWEEIEAASAMVHRALVEENAGRDREATITVIEYGVNLWLWAEPPSHGGDPVCHAGELISWEGAWALDERNPVHPPQNMASTSASRAAGRSDRAYARPPIFFGLPRVLHDRRRAD